MLWTLACTLLLLHVPARWVSGSSREVPFNFMPGKAAADYMESQLMMGRKQLEIFKSQEPVYGECWVQAVEKLQEGCKRLTEETQMRLALAFSFCFLKRSGMPVHPCPNDRPVEDCTQHLDERQFSTFRDFFTHTQSVCFYLQSQLWQQHTEHTISKLSSASARVGRQLEDSGRVQEKILTMQENSVRNQKQMVLTAQQMNLELENSRQGMQAVFDDVKSTTIEQKHLILDIFSRLSKLQTLVLGEFTSLYTVGFYAVACVICYLLTSSTRTADARFWLFLIFTVNAFIERTIATCSVDEENRQAFLLDTEGPIYRRMWLGRKLAILLAAITTIFCAVTYRDYNKCNYRLLQQIHQQNQELRREVNRIGFSDDESHGHKCTRHGWSDTSSDEDYHSEASSEVSDSEYDTSEESNHLTVGSNGVNNSLQIEPLPLETTNRSSTPDSRASTCSSSARYNLRPRASRSSPAIESPRSFARIVHHLARISKENSQTIRQTIQEEREQHRPFFSSDDD